MAFNGGSEYLDVHAIVNDIAKQAIGSKAVSVTDTASFVQFGDDLLKSNESTESFMNTLMLKGVQTYYTYRRYSPRLLNMMFSQSEWNSITQKIDGDVLDFTEDATFTLKDGKSIDQYIVRKPSAEQKLFVKKATYSNFLTWQRKTLQGAFENEGAFSRFTSMLNTKLRNKLDLALENLGKLTIASYIGGMADYQKIHLLTEYAAASGKTLKKTAALLDKDFLAWACGRIELSLNRLRDINVMGNAEGKQKFTPTNDIRLVVFDEFENAMQYTLRYQAFHDELVSMRRANIVSYWQGQDTRDKIIVTTQDGKEETVENIVGFAYDKYALGCMVNSQETHTSPYNARGRYFNSFYFSENMWMNDHSEQALVYLLD